MKVEDRFLKYVSFDTQSDENSDLVPTTMKQKVLAQELVNELFELGINNAYLDEYGIVYASIEKNSDGYPKIGFIAHMDTSPDMSGENIKPRIIQDYNGETIVLNEKLNIAMEPTEFTSLYENIHHDLIVTDGTTLLGGDDKAGVAEIMTMAETIMSNPQIPHGTIRIAFTPDEEVGKGTDHFNIKKFDADFAYTVDGSQINDVNYENFNAVEAIIKIQGLSIHPGSAKGKMINSQLLAMEFHSLLPTFDNPSFTEDYEGFNHLTNINGDCEHTVMNYIIRNHDNNLLAKQKRDFENASQFLQRKYPNAIIDLELTDTYSNMRNWIEKDMRVVDLAKQSIKDLGLSPISTAIRGGTDGARLTWDGLLCPNIGTGDYNCHGKFEYVSINLMRQSVSLIMKIIENSKDEQFC
ncbi:MAG: peptidase T [Erysipelotrichaceae bacterium]